MQLYTQYQTQGFRRGINSSFTQLAGALQRGKTHANECPSCDTKLSDSEVPVMLELWEMRITPS